MLRLVGAANALAIWTGLQNVPEGLAVPLSSEDCSCGQVLTVAR